MNKEKQQSIFKVQNYLRSETRLAQSSPPGRKMQVRQQSLIPPVTAMQPTWSPEVRLQQRKAWWHVAKRNQGRHKGVTQADINKSQNGNRSKVPKLVCRMLPGKSNYKTKQTKV